MSKSEPNYWIFSNKPEGAYKQSLWDMSSILKSEKYSLKEKESSRASVKPGDVVYLRTYSQFFLGKCIVEDDWKIFPKSQQKFTPHVVGYFPIDKVHLWSKPLPQALILNDLSNKNHRMRIARINEADALMIDTAQRVYDRLGFGGADGQILVLEKGLEEAIKPNLKKLGVKLASQDIRQQFSMGVGVGRSDLICEDEHGDLVVIELKRGMSSDEAIGQVFRYIGWLKENVAAEGQKVHGWIVAGDYDEHLRLAASAAKVRLLVVKLA